MVTLAKVTEPLDGPRGPDTELSLFVPATWLRPAYVLEVTLPRKLTCAACHGGGCDLCRRSGAVVLEGGEEDETLTLTLPEGHGAEEVRLRLPGYGGESDVAELPRGHLYLSLRAGEPVSSRVRLLSPLPFSLTVEERRKLMRRSITVALALGLTFVGLLRLSGWL